MVCAAPAQTEPPVQALSSTSAPEVSEPVEFAQPTFPEGSHPATDRPLPIGLDETPFAPGKTTSASFPISDSPLTEPITEQRSDDHIRDSQTEAAIKKENTNVQTTSTQSMVDEVQQSAQLRPERTGAIPYTRPQKPPIYRPPVPVAPVIPSRSPRQSNLRPSNDRDSELHIRVHLIFDRRGGVRSLSLVPDHRSGMPSEMEVTSTQGDFALTQFQDGCYQDVQVPEVGLTLRQGVTWQGKATVHRRWRWVLGGRELYVFAPGGEVGLSGFVSVPRLLLGEEHIILAVATFQVEVLSALAQAGCSKPAVFDQTFPGVPSGWLLFRGVKPTNAVPARDERHILNALCPIADISPHFVGGIRLEARSWLLGHPPFIRFTGQLDEKFAAMIDGQKAVLSETGGYIAPGWDSEGVHRLWFAEQSVTYELRQCSEEWGMWSAYDFGTGAVCGASVHPVEEIRWQVRVPSRNPVLLGAEPGQVFHFRPRPDLRAETWLAMVPFKPVWALPLDPAHVDKQSVRVVLVGRFEPVRPTPLEHGSRVSNRAVLAWKVCSFVSLPDAVTTLLLRCLFAPTFSFATFRVFGPVQTLSVQKSTGVLNHALSGSCTSSQDSVVNVARVFWNY